jgi:hypothetical protein
MDPFRFRRVSLISVQNIYKYHWQSKECTALTIQTLLNSTDFTGKYIWIVFTKTRLTLRNWKRETGVYWRAHCNVSRCCVKCHPEIEWLVKQSRVYTLLLILAGILALLRQRLQTMCPPIDITYQGWLGTLRYSVRPNQGTGKKRDTHVCVVGVYDCVSYSLPQLQRRSNKI